MLKLLENVVGSYPKTNDWGGSDGNSLSPFSISYDKLNPVENINDFRANNGNSSIPS